jgi:hypothetical protein
VKFVFWLELQGFSEVRFSILNLPSTHRHGADAGEITGRILLFRRDGSERLTRNRSLALRRAVPAKARASAAEPGFSSFKRRRQSSASGTWSDSVICAMSRDAETFRRINLQCAAEREHGVAEIFLLVVFLRALGQPLRLVFSVEVKAAACEQGEEDKP